MLIYNQGKCFFFMLFLHIRGDNLKPLILNIQKCSIHDGPGIRTTIFFKGCPLSCIWCHNPESQRYKVDFMYDKEKCRLCYKCLEKCDHHAICIDNNCLIRLDDQCELCGKCLDYCLTGSRELVGKEYEISSLVKEIEKDEIFYEESNGGVTLSGGEVMCQDMEYISLLISRLKNKGIHICIDTCGYAPTENFKKIFKDVDIFLYDIKVVDEKKHLRYTGKSNKLILENLKFLSSVNSKINIRIPMIVGVNCDDNFEEISRIIDILKDKNIYQVNLLPYHNIMEHKYCKLGMKYQGHDLSKPSDEYLENARQLFIKSGISNVKIGG